MIDKVVQKVETYTAEITVRTVHCTEKETGETWTQWEVVEARDHETQEVLEQALGACHLSYVVADLCDRKDHMQITLDFQYA